MAYPVTTAVRVLQWTDDAVDIDHLGAPYPKDSVKWEQATGRKLGVASVGLLVAAHTITGKKPAAVGYIRQSHITTGQRVEQWSNAGNPSEQRYQLSLCGDRDPFAATAGLAAGRAVIAEGSIQKRKVSRGHSPIVSR